MSSRHKIYFELGFDGQAGKNMTMTHTKGKGWGSCRAAAPTPPQAKFKRRILCRHRDIKFLCDFRLNQSLKSAD